MARSGRRRTVLIGAVAVLAVLVAGIAVVLAKPDGGGSAGITAVAPAYPAPGMLEKGPAADAEGDYPRSGVAGERAQSAPAPDGAPGPGAPFGSVQRALVRTAQVTVEVADPAISARQLRTAAAGVSAFVTQEQSSDTGSWLVLRVPADALDRFIEDIAAFGRVLGRSTQVLDATEEAVDLDARVASQQASVTRVRSLLAEATSIGDVVAIESELSRREADLDSLTSRLEALRDQVALSTLTVDLRAPGVPPAQNRPAPGFRDGLATGWEGLRALGSGAAAVIGFVLPFLPLLALLGGIAWLARRIIRARRTPAAAGAGGRGGPGSEGES